MRIGLNDVKKRISRADGELIVTPQLLGPRQLTRELEALIALHEAYLGRERNEFPQDRPAELIGDFRLARCLTICLDGWYTWRAAEWPGRASAEEAAGLAAAGIGDPSSLRLALYDRVNASAGGYLDAARRESTLDAFAAGLGIARRTLDDLLWLDSDDRATLARSAVQAPAPRGLALRYNQQAFEALLAGSSHVEWLLSAAHAEGNGAPLGATVKRTCFLARRFGVQYDVAFADPYNPDDESANVADPAPSLPRVAEQRALYAVSDGTAATAGREPLWHGARDVAITLYGPLEVTGAPQQYGERLARLCRALLGYRREQVAGAALATHGLSGSARVYVRGRPMRLRLDERLLRLVMPPAHEREAMAAEGGTPMFDSAVEERFFDEFTALERIGEARGWRLEREPEPVVAGDSILVPDFALTRGLRRVQFEIAGYWRPEYRERKVRKLLAARDAVDIIVAAPTAARDAFASLESAMPVLWYTTYPRCSAVLDLLDAAFDDFDQRAARADFPRIAVEVAQRGRVPPLESMAMLHCYTRAELARMLGIWRDREHADPDARPRWVEDVGLCSPAWVERVTSGVRALVAGADDGRLPLTAVTSSLAAAHHLPDLTAAGTEALTALAGLETARASLFAAEVLAPGTMPETPRELQETAPVPRQRQPRRPRERKSGRSAPATDSLFPAD